MGVDQQPIQKATFNWKKYIRYVSLIIGLGFLANIIIVLFFTDTFDPKSLFSFHPIYLLAALVLGLLPIYMHAYTLKLWGDYFKSKIAYKDSVNVAATTLLGSAVTPTMFGGAPLKLGLLVMHGFKTGHSAAVVAIGSIQDVIAFVVLVITSIYLSDSVDFNVITSKISSFEMNFKSVIVIVLIAVMVILALRFLLKSTVFGRKIRQSIYASLSDFKNAFKLIAKNGKGYFLFTTLISTLRWFVIYLILIALVKGLQLTGINYVEIFSLEWLVFSGMTFTPTPGAAGGAEAVFYFIYNPYFDSSLIVALILAWRFFTVYLSLIYAAILMVFFSRKA